MNPAHSPANCPDFTPPDIATLEQEARQTHARIKRLEAEKRELLDMLRVVRAEALQLAEDHTGMNEAAVLDTPGSDWKWAAYSKALIERLSG